MFEPQRGACFFTHKFDANGPNHIMTVNVFINGVKYP